MVMIMMMMMMMILIMITVLIVVSTVTIMVATAYHHSHHYYHCCENKPFFVMIMNAGKPLQGACLDARHLAALSEPRGSRMLPYTSKPLDPEP